MEQSVPRTPTHNNDQLLFRILTSQTSGGGSHQLLSALSKYRSGLFSQQALDYGLITACKIGNPLIVQGLINHGANLETRDERGMTPLLMCAELSVTELAKVLLRKGANVNAINHNGETPLSLSTYLPGSADMTKLLLEQPQVDINHRNNNGYSALMIAMEAENFIAAKLLIDAEKDETTEGHQERPMNSNGETVEKIAQRVGFADLLELMRREKSTGMTSLDQAVLNRDVKSVQFLASYNICAHDSNSKICRTLTSLFNSIKGNVQDVEHDIVRILCQNLSLEHEENENKEAVIELALGLTDLKLIQILCGKGFVGSYKSVSMAAAIGRRDILCVLLSTGAEINKWDSQRQIQYKGSPLDQAIQNGQFYCALELLERGAKIDVKLAMTTAVSGKDINALRYLVNQFPSNVRSAIAQSRFLQEAVDQGDTQTAKFLLENGANVNQVVNGKTPLMHATDVDMIDLLVGWGADVNLETSQEGAPLIYALSFSYHWNIRKRADNENAEGIGHFECNEKIKDIVSKLLAHVAKCNGVLHYGESPLARATQKCHPISLLKMLLDAGAAVNDNGPRDTSPLHAASVTCDTEKVQFLLDAGADVNLRDSSGQTPIFSSVDPEVIECLLKNGADVNVEDENGDTPLILAIESGEDIQEIFDIFIKAGCDVNHQNQKGVSAFLLAARFSNSEALKTLLEGGADVNACTKGSKPRTALDMFLKSIWNEPVQTGECIQALIAHGVNLLKINPCVIHILISAGCLSLAEKLISSAIGPTEVPLHRSVKCWYKSEASISPLGVALLLNNVKLARYFFEIRYLTKSDLSLLRRTKSLSKHLSHECLKFTQDASHQPLSLETLSLVAVSSVIGAAPGRRSRVEKTKLPFTLQSALLYTDIPPIVENSSEPKSLSLFRSLFKKYQANKNTDSSDESVQYSYDDLTSDSDF